jgi:hypothetical protein
MDNPNPISGADRITEIRRLKQQDLPKTIAVTKSEIAGIERAIAQLEKAHSVNGFPSQVDQIIELRRRLQRREQDLRKDERALYRIQSQELGKSRARLLEIDRLIPELETEREQLRAQLPVEETT